MASQIDLVFDEPEIVRAFSGLPISSQMCAYKERLYSIVHGGYSLLRDSRSNSVGTEIDGQKITSQAVIENGEFVGYKPSCPSKRVWAILPHTTLIIYPFQNSDYMAEYIKPFGKQVRAWLDQDCLTPNREGDAHSAFLGPVLTHKMTIEPTKPRLCLKYDFEL